MNNDFLAWREQHCPSLAARDAMLLYVRYLNSESKVHFDEQMEQWKAYMRSKISPEQKKKLEGLRARNDELNASISELNALHGTLMQAIVLTPQNTSQNILSLQVAPTPQNIPPPPEQSPPQIHSAPPPLEQTPSLNITPPSGEQMTDPPVADRAASPEVIDANKLTMQQIKP